MNTETKVNKRFFKRGIYTLRNNTVSREFHMFRDNTTIECVCWMLTPLGRVSTDDRELLAEFLLLHVGLSRSWINYRLWVRISK